MVEKGIFEEIELAEDLKSFIVKSPDVIITKELQETILNHKDGVLLAVTKKISSPTEIISVVTVDENYVEKEFTSIKK